jgi:N-glycosylase/DNA lyase
VTLRAKGKRLLVDVHKGTKAAAAALAARILGLEWDLARFHTEIADEADLSWITEGGHGRMLRSATLFEDLVKALFTTNTTWDRRKQMNDELVKQFGANTRSCPTFPHPSDIVGVDEHTLQDLIGCGYRARSVLAIAERALEDPDNFLGESWTALDPSAFQSLILGCRGIGPVSANYLCCVYGRCSGFAVDAYVRRRLRELWGGSHFATEKRLRQMQLRHRNRAPLILWLTITRHWHDSIRPLF